MRTPFQYITGFIIGAILLVVTIIVLSGCRSRLPEIKAQMLLEFGRYLPAEGEKLLIDKAGKLYALGFRQQSAGPYSVEIKSDQVYSPEKNLSLDLYLPNNPQRPLPLVLLVHGGGWQYFSKTAVSGVSHLLATNGFTVASVDYRLSKVAPWPAQLTDLRQAVTWLQAKATELGLDSKRWAVMGDSAGGHLAAMLALTSQPEQRPMAVVAYYGVYDLTALVSYDEQAAINPINQLLGVPPGDIESTSRTASPLHYVDENAPPFLLIHGLDDSLVPVAQTQAMAQKLQQFGASVETIYVQNADHLLLSLPKPIKPTLLEIDKKMLKFLRGHLLSAPSA